MGIKLTLTHLLYSASPGFCPVAANIPKKRLNIAGGEYCSSRLNVRFATVAGIGHELFGAKFSQRNGEDHQRRPATPAPPETCDSSLCRI